jgi:hypothetical protein
MPIWLSLERRPPVDLARFVLGALAVSFIGAPANGLAQTGPAVPQVPRAAVPNTAPADTFLDERARSLFATARAHWVNVESSIRSYEAIIRSRASVTLRAPLKDRTLYRAETAARARWSADSTLVVQMLAANEVTPEGPSPAGALAFTSTVYDPTSDQLYFGFVDREEAEDEIDGDDDDDDDDDEDDIEFEIEHPVAPGAEAFYRYQTGDSIQIYLPDGRSLRIVSLELIPRERSGRLLSGALWVEPESGALVRALYRLSTPFDLESELEDGDLRFVPAMFQPIQFDVTLVVVEYAYWDFRYWMPSRIRMEGFAQAGVINVPGAMEQSYEILNVVGADDPAEPVSAEVVVEQWRTDGLYGEFRERRRRRRQDAEPDSAGVARDSAGTAQVASSAQAGDQDRDRRREPRRFVLVPENPDDLHTSPLLPPPIGNAAAGFVTDSQIEGLLREVAALPLPEVDRTRFESSMGPEIGDLTRYNRAEGFSVGGRAGWTVATGGGSVGVEGLGWLGIGTWVPDARLSLTWRRPGHRLSAQAYTRVDEVDPRSRNLGVGNSLTALLFGRDDGDYFRASGGSLRWEPEGIERGWYHLTLSAEEHRPLPNEVDFSVAELLGGKENPFRPALPAERGTEVSAALGIEPWWGTDPTGAQGGLELLAQGAEGDFRWFRARGAGRLALPLVAGVRAGVEVEGGRIWGDAPLQRHWFLGGTRSLRGYSGAAAVGTSHLRGRAELARAFGATRWSVFSDWGWAGEAPEFDEADALLSAGVGLSLLDGLVRFDVARRLRAPRGWRVELYLDALL